MNTKHLMDFFLWALVIGDKLICVLCVLLFFPQHVFPVKCLCSSSFHYKTIKNSRMGRNGIEGERGEEKS